MTYSFNPHRHVKIWLTNNPDVFMNFENQMRLIEIREKNPNDSINLVYDSRLLNQSAHQELLQFCKENNFTPVDASVYKDTLIDDEARLYQFYEDEIFNLKDGGNLGIASDILRLLSPFYRLGTYTDLDVPLDTTGLPEKVEVEAPFLLNVGSVLFGNKEMILALNELIIVADEEAAKDQIRKLHKGILEKLENYSSDYMESVVSSLSQGRFLNTFLIESMKNRAEAAYIQKSTQIDLPKSRLGSKGEKTSRQLRGYINEIMSNPQKYLDFHRLNKTESNDQVVVRLRNELTQQLSFIKWLFFNTEYREIKRILALSQDNFVQYMMKKERSLYVKSIVVCTTGPIEVCKSFFGTYIMDSKEVDQKARPIAFSHYGLDKSFLSRNVVPLHENAWGMLQYLGATVGVRNDSSWLEEGASLQAERTRGLLEKKLTLSAHLPFILVGIEANIRQQIANLDRESKGGLFSFFINEQRKAAKKEALSYILKCFHKETQEFNILEFRAIVLDLQKNNSEVFAGYFSNRTRTIIEGLEHLCHDTKILRIAQDVLIYARPLKDTTTASDKSPALLSQEKERSRNISVSNPGRYSIGLFGAQSLSLDDDQPDAMISCGL